MGAHLAGEISNWPPKRRMAQILTDSGLRVYIGQFSVRVENCFHFVFQHYGGDLGEPVIDADADSVERLLSDAEMVSSALTCAKVRHRFEIYGDGDNLCGYLHFRWEQLKAGM